MCKNNLHIVCVLFTIIYIRKISVNSVNKIMKSKILIIEDNKSVLTTLEMLLQTEFDDVFTLSNPNSLISNIQQYI